MYGRLPTGTGARVDAPRAVVALPAGPVAAPAALRHHGGVKNPLDSLAGTVILGLALTCVLYLLVRAMVAG